MREISFCFYCVGWGNCGETRGTEYSHNLHTRNRIYSQSSHEKQNILTIFTRGTEYSHNLHTKIFLTRGAEYEKFKRVELIRYKV